MTARRTGRGHGNAIACRKTPCSDCPWRRDVPTGRFPPERFVALAGTAHDLARRVFACHQTPRGREFACAGYLVRFRHNFAVRMRGLTNEVSSPYPLYGSYREMAEANGVPPGHPALAPTRTD